MKSPARSAKIGLALGSGASRGWSHIGIIKALLREGIEPDIVCGTSVGAMIGACYVAGNLAKLENWVLDSTRTDVFKFFNVKLGQSGFVDSDRLRRFLYQNVAGKDLQIENLPKRYAAISTDLSNGREVWFQEGGLAEAVRASMALPGLFPAVRIGQRWLVDGGLVNPVPISVCRAMGADIIIAVNLNSDIVGRHLTPRPKSKKVDVPQQRDLFAQMMKQLNVGLRERAMAALRREPEEADESPGMLEVLASAINIMQDRITKSRMAGDPPDLLFTPQLGQLGLLEFDRADEAIAEGHACVARNLAQLQHVLKHAGLG